MDQLVGRWNYYFLRYGAGTIVGAVIVAIFFHRLGGSRPFFNLSLFQSQDGHFELNASAMTLLLVLGFAYCYIASAPGTVFHAARGLFSRQEIEAEPPPYFWKVLLSALLIGFVVSVLTCVVALCCHCCFWRFYFRLLLFAISVFASMTILALQWLLIVLTFTRFGSVRKFYGRLTEARAKGLVTRKTTTGITATLNKPDAKQEPTVEVEEKTSGTSEYVVSYRELKEHGNAFEIILLEIFLAITLSTLKGSVSATLLFIMLWVLPAALCWVVGTMLEFDLPRNRSNP